MIKVLADLFDVPMAALGDLSPIESPKTFLEADIPTATFLAEYMDLPLDQIVVIEGVGIFRYLGCKASESGYTVRFVLHF